MTFSPAPSGSQLTNWASLGDKTAFTTDERNGGYGLGKPLGLYPFSENLNFLINNWLEWNGYNSDAIAELAKNSLLYADNGSSANTIVLEMADTNAPEPTQYETGMTIRFFSPITNTDEVTIDVQGIGEVALLEYNGSVLESGCITEGSYYEAVYDGITGGGFRIMPVLSLLNKLTTKGDLLSHDGSSYAKLPIGSNGYVLTADSAESTGLKWVDKTDVSYTTYCANYGNTDTDGYADIITRVSDTEVSFKVGGAYANLGITFANGKHYEISSIADVENLNDDGTYTFVIYEENLTALGGGLYSAVVTAVALGYSSVLNIMPTMSANTQDGITISTTGEYGAQPSYYISDGNLSSFKSIAQESGSPYYFLIEFDTARDNLSGFSFQSELDMEDIRIDLYYSGSYTTVYTGDSFVLNTLHSVDFGSSYDGVSKVKITPLYRADAAYGQYRLNHFNLIETVTYTGGNITEGYTYPEAPTAGDLHLSINQNPMLPILYIADDEYISKQFVKTGEVTKSTSLGTPISYAFNGKYYYEQTSGNFINAQTVKNHNIGTTKIRRPIIDAKKYSDSTRYPLRAGSDKEPYYISSNNTIVVVADATPVFNIIASGLIALSIQNAATYGLIVDIERGF